MKLFAMLTIVLLAAACGLQEAETPVVPDPAAPARLNFQMVDDTVSLSEAQRGLIPPGAVLLDSAAEGQLLVRKKAVLSGYRIRGACVTANDMGAPAVGLRFDQEGAASLARLTQANVGKRMAVVFDGRVISAPVMRAPIGGSRMVIEGGLTKREVADLVSVLKASSPNAKGRC